LHFHIKLVNAYISVFFVRVGGALVCFNFFFKRGRKILKFFSWAGQTHSLASFGLSLGMWGLTMCVAAALAHTAYHNTID